MIILDKMIMTGRFAEFVCEFVRIRNEEIESQTRWEFWLHRVFDMTYQEFISRINGTEAAGEDTPSQQELQTIVNDSWGTLNSFCPE